MEVKLGDMWVTVSFLGILICTFLANVNGTLYSVVRYNNQLPLSLIDRFTARSKIDCVATCGKLEHCLAVYYTSNNSECWLLQVQRGCYAPWTPSDSTDIILKADGDPIELAVFRVSSGTGAMIYSPWVTDSYIGPCGADVLDMGHKIDFTYKHPILKNWTAINIKQVRLTLWTAGTEVVRLLLDGRSSTKLNWFSPDRLLESSFTDLIGNTKATLSIPDSQNQRRFYVWKSYGTCFLDKGWMFFKETDHTCFWENHRPYPSFTYSKSGGAITWFTSSDVGRADDLLISLVVEI